MNKRKLHPQTEAIHSQAESSPNREHSAAIYMTSSFTFESAEQARAIFAGDEEGFIYSRYGNPNDDEFVQRMCRLEGAEAGLAFASGMSAVFTAMAGLLNSGDHVLASKSLFSSTHQILNTVFPRWGIESSLAELTRPESWLENVRPNTRLCIVETPSNPALDLVDISWLAGFCSERDIVLVVDNVFATPILQKPLLLGANLVVHSATKYIDGQGRAMGGVLVGDRFLIEELTHFIRHTGPTLSPINSWLFSKSLETLTVRVERHCENALALAECLEMSTHVEAVRYPHLPSHPQYELARRQMKLGGGIVAFEAKGGLDRGRRFLDALQLCNLTANLGDTRTIATHPASTTHFSLTEEQRLEAGITPGLVRISVGLEHVDDIIADVDQALERSAR